MVPDQRWFDRGFEFTLSAELYPVVLERLRGLLPKVLFHAGSPRVGLLIPGGFRRTLAICSTSNPCGLAVSAISQGSARSAKYPRLDQSMRVIDLALSVAEHDDHHLARVNAIAAKLGSLV